MATEVEHPVFGPHPRLTSLIGFSRSSTRAEPGITVGQHTDAVLRELGVEEKRLAALAEAKVILRG